MNNTNNEFALKINNLVKSYPATNHCKGKIALNSLNLNIKKGRIFGLLGPNGAGKSTLINILAGITNKTSGQVKVLQYDIDEQPQTFKRQIGVVPQEIILDNFFPIKKLLEFTAGYYGLSPKECDIDGILKILGLYDKRNNLSRELSGGMKRRMLIAKAMVHSPKILVLDEPTAGVDIELRTQLWDYIKKLNSAGTTIILTTHYLEEAQELCDEIAFINHGNIIAQDLKDNLLQNLGSKNLLVEFYEELDNSTQLKFKEYNFDIISHNKISKILKNQDNINSLVEYILSVNLSIKDIQIGKLNIEDVFRKLIKLN